MFSTLVPSCSSPGLSLLIYSCILSFCLLTFFLSLSLSISLALFYHHLSLISPSLSPLLSLLSLILFLIPPLSFSLLSPPLFLSLSFIPLPLFLFLANKSCPFTNIKRQAVPTWLTFYGLISGAASAEFTNGKSSAWLQTGLLINKISDEDPRVIQVRAERLWYGWYITIVASIPSSSLIL